MQYIKNVMRLAYIQNDIKLDSLKGTKTYDMIYSYWKEKHPELLYYDFFYLMLGYSNDANLAPRGRYNLRRDVMHNMNNNEFWNNLRKKYKVKSIENVVDYLSYLDVLGVGKISASIPKAWSFNKINDLLSNKELVEVFQSGCTVVNSTATMNGRYVPMSQIVSLFSMCDYKTFKAKKKMLSFPLDGVLNVTVGDTIVLRDGVLQITEDLSKLNKKWLIENLIYLSAVRADKIDLAYIDLFNTSMLGAMDLFALSDYDFLNLIDVSNLLKLDILSMFNLIGRDIPDLRDMIDKSYGIYMLVGKNISYLTEALGTNAGFPAQIDANYFAEFINNEEHVNIVYKDRVPMLNDQLICDGGVLSEVHYF